MIDGDRYRLTETDRQVDGDSYRLTETADIYRFKETDRQVDGDRLKKHSKLISLHLLNIRVKFYF